MLSIAGRFSCNLFMATLRQYQKAKGYFYLSIICKEPTQRVEPALPQNIRTVIETSLLWKDSVFAIWEMALWLKGRGSSTVAPIHVYT